MAKLLVVGGSGFIGGRLVGVAVEQGQAVAYTYARRPLPLPNGAAYLVDFNQPQSNDGLDHCIKEFQPDVVIYCAVPLPTAEYELHRRVSVEGVQRVIELLQQRGQPCRLLYVSTNAVFGNGRGLYREDELPDTHLRLPSDPYQAYALTKAEGERLVLSASAWPDSLVARTAIVDGRLMDGSLSYRVHGLVRALRAGQPLVRFDDRFISPTLVDNLVEALLEISHPTWDYRGVLHLAGSQRTTDYEYALALARRLDLPTDLVQANSLKDVPAMLGSPPDTSLDITLTQSLLQTRLLDVEEQLARLFHNKIVTIHL